MRLKSLISIACTAWALSALVACNPMATKKPDSSEAPVEQAAQEAAVQAEAPKAAANVGLLMMPEKLHKTAPDKFTVKVTTTKGDFKIDVERDLAPIGVDRFYNLVTNGYFDDIALFRMAKGFVVQFGIHGKPIVSGEWREANIDDDPVKGSNTKGTITFATAGPNTRTTQLFINLGDNVGLDNMGFAPFGKVTEGMDIIDKLNFEYGERPDQGKIQMQGNTYLKANFPNLDYIVTMTIE